jgi:hypothetical protein
MYSIVVIMLLLASLLGLSKKLTEFTVQVKLEKFSIIYVSRKGGIPIVQTTPISIRDYSHG